MSSPDFVRHAVEIRDFEKLMVPAGKTPWIRTYRRPDRANVDVLLYLGCNILRTAHLAQEVIGVFQALGIDFVAVAGPQFCCGAINKRGGDIEGAARRSRATVDQFASYGPRQVVIWCPTCRLRFAEVLDAKSLPFSMVHTTSFLAEKASRFSFRRGAPARVAVHTHIGEPQREIDAHATIRILEAVPGVEVVGALSSPELDYQCGPASIAKLGPENFLAFRTGLVQKAGELGADTLVTPYHSCHRTWCEVGNERLAVRNYISLVAEALGCAHRDRFQEFTRLKDPDAIAALSRPVWETHGLSEAQAKELAARYFAPGNR